MKDLKIYIFIVSALLIFYLVAQYNRPKAVDWTASLRNTDKIPFGTYILYTRVNDIFQGASVQTFREPVYNVLNDHAIKRGTYIIICNSINLNDDDYKKLTRFINDGNDVFIASAFFGEYLEKELKITTGSELNDVGTRLMNKTLDTNLVYMHDKTITNVYFNNLDTARAVVLGENNLSHANFVKYNIGKGALYLNANPCMFSNYSLLNKSGRDYAEYALSYVKNDKNLLWDEYYTAGRVGSDNVMRVFLQHDELKWAFYLAYFSFVIFVLYEMKRRQRIIPVIEPLKNATVDFVNVVGQVYYEQRNNSDIVQKKILYFLEYLRTNYHLKTNPLDNEFIKSLSKKTGIDPQFAAELVDHINYVSVQFTITDHELIVLNQLIEKFYSQS